MGKNIAKKIAKKGNAILILMIVMLICFIISLLMLPAAIKSVPVRIIFFIIISIAVASWISALFLARVMEKEYEALINE